MNPAVPPCICRYRDPRAERQSQHPSGGVRGPVQRLRREWHDTNRRELDARAIRFSIVHSMHLTAALGDYANLRVRVLESEDIHELENVHVGGPLPTAIPRD